MPAPLYLVLRVCVRGAPNADLSRPGFRGFSLPAPSGVAEKDRDSVSGSVDLDRDDSFGSVLHLIREFHSMEEPASVAPNPCKGRQTLTGPARGSVVFLCLLLRERQKRIASVSGSVDLDRDDSYGSVLHLIREFHSMEEPASVAPKPCKTSLALIYGLQSESSPALHLPLSPLLSSLLEDTNLALAKFVEDQTVHRFLPVPSRYHRTSSSSFPGPYTVPPGLASITLDKVSESRKRSVSLSHSQVSSLEIMYVSLSHSQVSSLEIMLSSVCEVTS